MILLMLGYATFLVATTQVFIPFGFQQLATETVFSRLVENTSFFLAYLIIGVVMIPRASRAFPRPIVRASLVIIAVGQIVFYFHNFHALELWLPILFVLHVLSGASFSVLFSFWASTALYIDGKGFRFFILAGSLIASFTVIFINACQIPLIILLSKCVALLVSGALVDVLWLKRPVDDLHVVPQTRKGLWGRGKSQTIKSLRGLFTPVVCTGILGFAYQYSWIIVGVNNLSSLFFTIGEAFAVSIIFLVVAMPYGHSFDLAKLYRLLCPIAALCIVGTYFSRDILQLLFMGVNSAAFNLCLILLMPLCASIGKRKGISVPGLYAAAAGVVNLFPTLGYAIGAVPPGVETAGLYAVVLVLLLAILLCVAFFAERNDYGLILRMGESIGSNDAEHEDAPTSILGRNYVVALISAEYGLSDREEEILRLIALGRNAPAISEELFITKNTVKTHVKRIYHKLGIHSRQELADLIEEFEDTL